MKLKLDENLPEALVAELFPLCHTPKSRLEFWLPKFAKNVARDRLVTRILRKDGWRVLRVWECDLAPKRQARVVRRIRKALDRG